VRVTGLSSLIRVLRTTLSAAALLILYVPVGEALAADEASGAGEILVTARRYEERLQDTPLAATVFRPDQIEARSSANLADLAEFAPNIGFDSTASLSGSSNAASIFIRGVGQTDFAITTDPGIGVYVDGVYLARATGSDLDLLDFEQIEILRGPQGTLFGRNTIGGAISLATRKPKLKTIAAEAEVTFGRFDRFDLRAVVNLPVAENAALRLAAARQRRDGFGRRILTGQHLGGQDRYTLRLSGLWQPTPTIGLPAMTGPVA
jgi:iron complex outermembrane recepter protein